MELHQIRYFLALCAELNFTRAAEHCGVAQSSLTRAIKALEAELGGALFHRERANSHLSKLGQRVKPFLEQAYSYVEGAGRQAEDFVRVQSGCLRLGLMSTIAPAHLIGLIDTIRTNHPAVTLQITDAPAEILQQRLLAGDLDSAIYALPSLATDARLTQLPLYREPFVVALWASHRLARRDAISIRDLAGEARIRRSHCECEAVLCDAFARQGAESRTVYRSDRDDWVLAMVSAGLGYALITEMSANASGAVTRPLVDPEIFREIALVRLRGRVETPGMAALLREATRWGPPAQPSLTRDRLALPR